MKHRRLTRAFLICLCVALLCANGALCEAGSEPEIGDQAIIDCVVDNFMSLAAIPRPSHHEEKISAFFMDWARAQGFEPVRDALNNVMFELPATEGCEDYPLGILQGHVDMVVAVAEGKAFDPLNDPITVVRDDEAGTLTADGTSLGGDDGVGCAMAMAIAQGGMAHGPLRVILTTDEEDGMEGAFNMDPSWLDGAVYLMNVDNEASDEVVVSSAAGDSVRASGAPEFADAAGNLALNIALRGLKGGHSGIEIDRGRLNGVIGLAGFLAELEAGGIEFELSAFEGGEAANAIPTKAECVIVIDGSDVEAVKKLAEAYFGRLEQDYAGIEDAIAYDVTEASDVPRVVSANDRENALRFITQIIDGVYTWSADMEGLVESSSNLGIFMLNSDGVSAATYVRSSVAELETEILDAQLELAGVCGYATETVKMADAWPYDPDSRLLALTRELYRAQNGEDIRVSAVHAGLECGTFKALNPDLDMVCIGADLSDPHTVNETLYLNSIPRLWRLVEALFAQVDRLGE